MLQIVEISSDAQLQEKRAKEDNSKDYLYILKHTGKLLLSDNGTAINMCESDNKEVLDSITTDSNGNILYNESVILLDNTKDDDIEQLVTDTITELNATK